MGAMKQDKIKFEGIVLTVNAKIRLIRSFDQIPTHQYQGYTLVLSGKVLAENQDQFKVGIGPKAHETHQFRMGAAKLAKFSIPALALWNS